MNRTAVLNVVGLTGSLIGPAMPNIARLAAAGSQTRIKPAFPAVTCTAQTNYLTGKTPSHHGIVGNGWYDRTLAETHFWKQSNNLVTGPLLWDDLRQRNPGFTCAQLFWWYNMYSSADYSITPRPAYPADGRKIFDIYTNPPTLRHEIKKDLGEFPFPAFWGPAAGVKSAAGSADAVSRWIAASAKWIEERYKPTLNLVYLPHLDYNLQRHGPGTAGALNPAILPDLAQIDSIVGDLAGFFAQRGVKLILLSEYGITDVDTPVHLNRLFRQQGWLAVREELGLELLDAGASRVFAVADHQVAHIYVRDASLLTAVRKLLESQPGVESVWGEEEKTRGGLNHARAGDLVAIASPKAWFTYYYWLDNARAPDFARCVDIHRKPGYDPVELFLDPKQPLSKLKILWRLAQKRLGFRMLMDVIPLQAELVKGSHGRANVAPTDQPVLILPLRNQEEEIDSTAVRSVIEQAIET